VTREIRLTASFEKLIKRLPRSVREQAYEKLALYIQNPKHPSLRVKRIKGTDAIWELSVTMSYRVTFELPDDKTLLLRRIGTHDILKKP
jgi:mRNA-degrading endonuclease RelE of RelBE toxin-antitoxin system